MEGRRSSRAGQLRIPAASAQSFPAGLISHLEREGESRGGEPAGEGLSPPSLLPSLPPPLPSADFTSSLNVLSLHLSRSRGGIPIFGLGVLLEGCLA